MLRFCYGLIPKVMLFFLVYPKICVSVYVHMYIIYFDKYVSTECLFQFTYFMSTYYKHLSIIYAQ